MLYVVEITVVFNFILLVIPMYYFRAIFHNLLSIPFFFFFFREISLTNQFG